MHWKDQPLAVATVAILGTTVFFVTVVKDIWLTTKENQIEDQRKKIASEQQEIRALQSESGKLNKKISDLNAQIRTIEDSNIRLQRNFDNASAAKLFSPDEPYPRGFQAIKIGDNIDLVSRIYETVAEVTDYGAMVVVKLNKPAVFHQMAYYCNQYATPRTVTHILFQFDPTSEKQQFVKSQLNDAFGELRMSEITTKRKEKKLRWSLDEYALDLSETGITVLKLKN